MSESGEQNFEKLKTRYWARKAVSSIAEMRQNKKTGLFPKEEGWRNVVEHELVEAEAADVLAEKLGLLVKERETLKISALLHDSFKRREKEMAEKEGISGFDQSAQSQLEFLRSLGYPEEIILLAGSTGHTSLEEFNRDFDSIPTIRKIMHYVDDVVLGNDIVPLDERIGALERNPRYAELNEQGRKKFDGKTYFEVQREISKRIEREFAPKLGLSDPSTIPVFIKDCISERIAQSEL